MEKKIIEILGSFDNDSLIKFRSALTKDIDEIINIIDELIENGDVMDINGNGKQPIKKVKEYQTLLKLVYPLDRQVIANEVSNPNNKRFTKEIKEAKRLKLLVVDKDKEYWWSAKGKELMNSLETFFGQEELKDVINWKL